MRGPEVHPGHTPRVDGAGVHAPPLTAEGVEEPDPPGVACSRQRGVPPVEEGRLGRVALPARVETPVPVGERQGGSGALEPAIFRSFGCPPKTHERAVTRRVGTLLDLLGPAKGPEGPWGTRSLPSHHPSPPLFVTPTPSRPWVRPSPEGSERTPRRRDTEPFHSDGPVHRFPDWVPETQTRDPK